MKKTTKKVKNNLDERQEAALLKTESKGFWLVYWLLLAAILIQTVLYTTERFSDIPPMAGEWIVFMVMCIYAVRRCMKDNVWDRRLKPDFKTNLLLSLGAGVVVGILSACIFLINRVFDVPAILIAAGVGFVLTAAMCLIALSMFAAAYKKKRAQLEEEEADEE